RLSCRDTHSCVLLGGGDLLSWSLPAATGAMPPNMRLVHLDTDPWEIGKNYPAHAAILGDPKATLPEITAAVRARMTAGQRAAARERLKGASDANTAEREALVAKARSLASQTPVQPLALLPAIGETLPEE